LGPGRYGLTGPNGGGKTTLLRLITGELRPDAGSVAVQGEVAYLPQRLEFDPAAPVRRLLGIEDKLNAIQAIEDGGVDQEHFDTIGEDWDIAARAGAALAALGLGRVELDRPAVSLSGGEAVLVALAAALGRRPGVLLADEPTNNLDVRSRRYLTDGIGRFKGLALVVTHDRSLLDQMDRIGELREGQLAWYDAPFAAFEAAKAGEAEAKRRAVVEAKADLGRERRDLASAQTKQARRDQMGRRAAGSLPPILAQARRGRAQVTAGKSQRLHEGRRDAARERLDRAKDQLDRTQTLKLDLPGSVVPKGRDVLELEHVRPRHTALDVSLQLRGPERIALTGPNGIGKTSLLRCVARLDQPTAGLVRVHVPVRLSPQNLDSLDGRASALENILAAADAAPAVCGDSLGQVHHRSAPAQPAAEEINRVRAGLARLGLGADKAERPVATLSGGERWRATLAALLLTPPAPRLILLDEPTNNLDLESVAVLTEALIVYPGAFIVVSHDLRFLMEIGPSQTVDLTPAR
jgi:ATPase subunit of ABC transporter with duplicated ATPase domains